MRKKLCFRSGVNRGYKQVGPGRVCLGLENEWMSEWTMMWFELHDCPAVCSSDRQLGGLTVMMICTYTQLDWSGWPSGVGGRGGAV